MTLFPHEPTRVAHPVPDGRWGIEQLQEGGWVVLTVQCGYLDPDDAQGDVDKLNAGGGEHRVFDRYAGVGK